MSGTLHSTHTKFKIEFRESGKRCFRPLYRRIGLAEALSKLAIMVRAAREGRGRKGLVRIVDPHGKPREETDLVAVREEHLKGLELEAQGRVADLVAVGGRDGGEL